MSPCFYNIDSTFLTSLDFFVLSSNIKIFFNQKLIFLDSYSNNSKNICIILLLSINNHYMSNKLSVYGIDFMYQTYLLIIYHFKASKATKQHQWSIIILMMIQHIPCKQASIFHVAVESNLYFSYTIVLLHCINTVMTRVVWRPFTLINSFDRHGFLHVMFVIKIIQSSLSALLWCMQIHVQNGSKQWTW